MSRTLRTQWDQLTFIASLLPVLGALGAAHETPRQRAGVFAVTERDLAGDDRRLVASRLLDETGGTGREIRRDLG